MRIVCQQTILMKYHALFVIFEKAEKIEIIGCALSLKKNNSRRQKACKINQHASS